MALKDKKKNSIIKNWWNEENLFLFVKYFYMIESLLTYTWSATR